MMLMHNPHNIVGFNWFAEINNKIKFGENMSHRRFAKFDGIKDGDRPNPESSLAQLKPNLTEQQARSNGNAGYAVSPVCDDLWFVMRNKHNNVIGYGAQALETVEQWCAQNLLPGSIPDVDYDIIIIVKEKAYSEKTVTMIKIDEYLSKLQALGYMVRINNHNIGDIHNILIHKFVPYNEKEGLFKLKQVDFLELKLPLEAEKLFCIFEKLLKKQ